MNLYEDLKKKVDAAGFTMKAVCEKAGVSSGTPSHWAASPQRTKPTQRTYDKLIHALKEMIEEREQDMKAVGVS